MTSDEIREAFEDGSKQFGEIRDLLGELKRDVADAKKAADHTKDIVEAWLALKKAGGFLRWLGGVLASAMAVYLAIRGVMHK
jgi:hypothetical protein